MKGGELVKYMGLLKMWVVKSKIIQVQNLWKCVLSALKYLSLLSLQLPFELEVYYIQHVMLYVVPIYLLWKGGKSRGPYPCTTPTPRLSLLFWGITNFWVPTRILNCCLTGFMQHALCQAVGNGHG